MLLAQDLTCQTNRIDDLDIARTAAVVVADGKANLLVRRLGGLVKQALGAQHHARNAEAALHRAGLAERKRVGGFFKIRQSLNGQNVLALQALRVRNAGAARLALDQHGTRAAGALAAAVLDGRQTQLVAQITQELLLFCNVDFPAVDVKYGHNAGLLPVGCAFDTNYIDIRMLFLGYKALYNKTLPPARRERYLFCRIAGTNRKIPSEYLVTLPKAILVKNYSASPNPQRKRIARR